MAQFTNPTTGVTVDQENRDIQDLANQGFSPVADETAANPSILSSASLAQESDASFENLVETPPDDITGLEVSDPVELTPTGTQAQSFSDQIISARNNLLGESAFTAGQEEAQGLPGLQQTQTDLTARMKALQNEASAIPMLLQQESAGRGRTVGGLRPLQTARLRENAIQTLTTASQLEASRGNIATAQTLVDRAVAQKYDPIREQIAVATANLQTILDSPKFKAEDKALAQKQLDIQNKKAADLAAEEAEEKAVKAVGIEAARFGIDAVTLDRINRATTELEATQIAQAAGVYTSEKDDALTLKEGEFRFEKDASGNYVPVAGIGKEEKPKDPKDFIQTVGDTLLQYNEATGKWDTIFTSPEKSDASETSQYKNWKLAVADGSNLTFTEWMGKQNPGEMSSYMQQMNSMILDTVGELEGMTNKWTTGPGGLLANLPSTDARNFKAKLSTLKANIGFGALTSMREASKTGGALGQVSNIELGLLTSTLGGLDQLQTAEQFDAELKKVRDSITRWQDAIENFATGGASADGDIEDYEWEF